MISVSSALPEKDTLVKTNLGEAMYTDKGWILILPSRYPNYATLTIPTTGVVHWKPIK